MTNVTFVMAVKHKGNSLLIVISVKYFGLLSLLGGIAKTTRKLSFNRAIFYLLFILENSFNSYLAFLKNKLGTDKKKIQDLVTL